ncbi:conserved hypothetical protein [Burkholderia pseudomallei 668]|nr:conserved hypothetical protein [Burkholderia pseudomallei 668]
MWLGAALRRRRWNDRPDAGCRFAMGRSIHGGGGVPSAPAGLQTIPAALFMNASCRAARHARRMRRRWPLRGAINRKRARFRREDSSAGSATRPAAPRPIAAAPAPGRLHRSAHGAQRTAIAARRRPPR